jgi:hypothetical protein
MAGTQKYQDQATSALKDKISAPPDGVVIKLIWDGGPPFDKVYHAIATNSKKLGSSAKQRTGASRSTSANPPSNRRF